MEREWNKNEGMQKNIRTSKIIGKMCKKNQEGNYIIFIVKKLNIFIN